MIRTLLLLAITLGCFTPTTWATLPSYRNAPNINTDYIGWIEWHKERKRQFEANCPYERSGATFYVDATAVDNSGDGLSAANAKRDLSEIATYLSANSGDLSGTTISIAGGQRYVATGNVLTYTGDDLTIRSSNGTPAIIDRFSIEYNEADDDWGSQSGDRWQVSESTDIAWVKLRSDPYGEGRGTHLVRASSAADCESTDNSFFHDGSGNVLYLNLAGDDPNDFTIDALPDNQDDGVSFSGDGNRLQDITFLGFGMDPSQQASQKQGATNRSSGDDSNYYKNAGSYYSGTHALAHYLDGSGGRSYWENCHSGFCQYGGSGGETIHNIYSRDGNCEAWIDGCEVRYGTLKDNAWSWSTDGGRGRAFYGHRSTSDTTLDLIVMVDSVGKNSHTPTDDLGAAANLPVFDVWDLSAARQYLVRCTKEMPTVIGGFSLSSNVVHKGCHIGAKPTEESTTDSTGTVRPNNCYYLDCAIDFDLGAWAGGQFSIFNGSSGDRNLHFANSSIIFINNNSTGNGRGLFDYDAQYAGYAGESGAQGSIVNSIIATDDPGSQGNFNLGFGNASNILINNAYYGIVSAPGGSSTDKRGFAQDDSAVGLSAMPQFGVESSELIGSGSTKRVSTHDINGRKRIAYLPDVGPYDFRTRALSLNEIETVADYIGQDIIDRPSGLVDLDAQVQASSGGATAPEIVTAINADATQIALQTNAADAKTAGEAAQAELEDGSYGLTQIKADTAAARQSAANNSTAIEDLPTEAEIAAASAGSVTAEDVDKRYTFRFPRTGSATAASNTVEVNANYVGPIAFDLDGVLDGDDTIATVSTMVSSGGGITFDTLRKHTNGRKAMGTIAGATMAGTYTITVTVTTLAGSTLPLTGTLTVN